MTTDNELVKLLVWVQTGPRMAWGCEMRPLADDCVMAADSMQATNTFPTGQGILREAAARIRELEAQLQTVLDREAATHKRYDDKMGELEAQLADATARADTAPLAAAAMMDAAVKSLRDWQSDLIKHRFHDTAVTVGIAADLLETLPLPTPAEMLAAALRLPEVAEKIDQLIAEKTAAEMGLSIATEDAIRDASIKSMDDAQKMILDHLDGCHAIYMMGKGRDPKKYTSKYSLAAGQLRTTLTPAIGETDSKGAGSIMCGGCGATRNADRCIGCLHDFGTPESAWVRKYTSKGAGNE